MKTMLPEWEGVDIESEFHPAEDPRGDSPGCDASVTLISVTTKSGSDITDAIRDDAFMFSWVMEQELERHLDALESKESRRMAEMENRCEEQRDYI
jgi:hypothetical protein